jgi:hypothetical protein
MIVKDDRRKQIAVLGDGNRRHLQLRGLIEHFIDATCAIQKRVFGVEMEVDKLDHDSRLTDFEDMRI